MTNSKKKILLIDGNAFCYRAFYAIRSLSTSSGEPTNAIYGFMSMLNKIIAKEAPQYLAVAFDLKGPTFRHQRFADYKAHRKPMPDDLIVQIPIIKEVLKAYNFAIFEQEGYEGDDIIATLAKCLNSSNLEILLVTPDKDMLQLVNDNIKILNPRKDNGPLGKSWVKERFGVTADKIVEIMALAGDAADNIPGVPGIGEATAIELIKKYGSLEEVLINVDKIKHKSKANKLREFSEQAKMSKELATLDADIPQLKRKKQSELLTDLKIVDPDREKLFKLFKKLEFKALMSSMAPEKGNNSKTQIICGKDNMKQLREQIGHKKAVAVYFSLSGTEAMRSKVLAFALNANEKESFLFKEEDLSLPAVKQILEDKNIKKIGHNLKYIKVLLSKYAIKLNGISFDVMLAAYLLNPENAKYPLSDITLEHLNYKLEEPVSLEKDAECAHFCCSHAQALLPLSRILKKQLTAKDLFDLFEQIEMPLVEVLSEIEQEGITIDRNYLLHLADDFTKRLNRLTRDIYTLADETFNINSPKQLSVILFEKLGLPKIKRTKTGISTDTEVLNRLAQLHPIASELLEFREISKLKSTYVDGLLKLAHLPTEKLHTTFNQAATATGRLSSSRPNLQNIPIKTPLGKKIRQAFIAEKKTEVLLSADYSQIELRILAHLSADKSLIQAFKDGLDVHAHTASLIFGVDIDEISRQMRNTAKVVNFGIIYGMSAFGLAKDLGIEQAKAHEFIQSYFTRYPGVKKFIDDQIEHAKVSGFVVTLMKRRRYIPQIKSTNESVRQFAQRIAINAPVQGSASDLIKTAMIRIHQAFKTENISARMLLQVHDELVFAAEEKDLEKAKSLIKDKMENVLKLKVPIEVSIKVGKNWLEMS